MAVPAPDAPFRIRLAAPNDRSSIEAVVDAAYRRYVPLIGGEPGPMLDDYGALIREDHVHVLVAGGAVRGVLVLIPEREIMLLDIIVDPACQGRGYGRALLEFAERTGRAAGCGARRHPRRPGPRAVPPLLRRLGGGADRSLARRSR